MKKITPVNLNDLVWTCKAFDTMSAFEFYEIAKLRQQVFILEQACLFSDLDELDPITYHLLATQNNQLIAYSRILPPHKAKDPVYISRICTDIHHRKHGIGRALMEKGLEFIQKHYPQKEIVISAQSHLEKFYSKLGFEKVGKIYLEDGIPHIPMRIMPKK